MKREVICGVYCFENIVNGKKYIGSSNNILKRKYHHLFYLRKGQHHSYTFQNDFNKFGESSFKHYILEKCSNADPEVRIQLEQKYMDEYTSYDKKYGYNINSYASTEGIRKGYTLSTLESGNAKITLLQFNMIINYLCNSDISFNEISQLTKVSQSSISSIYYRVNYKDLTNEMVFINRNNAGENNGCSKLTKDNVLEIIIMLTNSISVTQIANLFNVSYTTIEDIHKHRTWKSLTSSIIFPNLKNEIKGHKGKQIAQYDLNGNLLETFMKAVDAEKKTGVSRQNISSACRGIYKSYGGFIWKFCDISK